MAPVSSARVNHDCAGSLMYHSIWVASMASLSSTPLSNNWAARVSSRTPAACGMIVSVNLPGASFCCPKSSCFRG